MRFIPLTLTLFLFVDLLTAQGDRTPSTSDVMKKLNRGPNSITPTLGKDLKDDDPDWQAIQDQTKEYVTLTQALTKNEPSKGEKASWQRMAQTYAADAAALDKAAKAKDRKGASAALARINKSCNACHQAHKKD